MIGMFKGSTRYQVEPLNRFAAQSKNSGGGRMTRVLANTRILTEVQTKLWYVYCPSQLRPNYHLTASHLLSALGSYES